MDRTKWNVHLAANAKLVLAEMGADPVIWAQDYPYVKGDAKTFLMNTPIPEEDKEKIAHGNIEKLLKLK